MSGASGSRRPSTRLLVLLAGGLVLAALGVVLGAGAWNLAAARDAGERARSALAHGDIGGGQDAIATAARRFQRADRWLHNPFARAAGWVPLAGRNVRAAAAMARAGSLLTGGATDVLGAASTLPGGLDALKPAAGAIPLEPLDTLAAPLRSAAAAADEATATLAASPDRWLLPPVADARHDLGEVLDDGSRSLRIGAALTSAIPAFLGADVPRQYLLFAANPAELRGSGGFLGAYTILTADRGRVSLAEFSSIHELDYTASADASAEFERRYGDWFALAPWLNANLTPDFPTAASLLEQLYLDETGQRVDGVIVTDPFALQALVALGDPVDVPGVGEVAADNVVEVVANQAYDLFDSEDERKTVLGSIAVAGIENLLSGAVEPEAAMETLGAAAAHGHLLLHAADPQVQHAFETARIAGAFSHPGGDFVSVIGNNGAQNKADYYTDRSVHYRVELHPDGLAAAGLGVRLANHTPTDGITSHVIGPNLGQLEAGDNLTHLSVYCAACSLVTYDGPAPDLLESDSELGYRTFGIPVHLPSGETRGLAWSWTTDNAWEADGSGGTYRLTLHNQQTIRPSHVRVEVVPPEGMRIARTSPEAAIEADGTVVYEGQPRGHVALDVTLAVPTARRVWDFLSRPVFRVDGTDR